MYWKGLSRDSHRNNIIVGILPSPACMSSGTTSRNWIPSTSSPHIIFEIDGFSDVSRHHINVNASRSITSLSIEIHLEIKMRHKLNLLISCLLLCCTHGSIHPHHSTVRTAAAGIPRGGASSINPRKRVVKAATKNNKKATNSITTTPGASVPNEIFNLAKSIVGAGVLGLPAGESDFVDSVFDNCRFDLLLPNRIRNRCFREFIHCIDTGHSADICDWHFEWVWICFDW